MLFCPKSWHDDEHVASLIHRHKHYEAQAKPVGEDPWNKCVMRYPRSTITESPIAKRVRSVNSINRVLNLQLKHINEINLVNLLIHSLASEIISLTCFISIILFAFLKVYSWING